MIDFHDTTEGYHRNVHILDSVFEKESNTITSENETSFGGLPLDIFSVILNQLNPSSSYSLSRTSKYFYCLFTGGRILVQKGRIESTYHKDLVSFYKKSQTFSQYMRNHVLKQLTNKNYHHQFGKYAQTVCYACDQLLMVDDLSHADSCNSMKIKCNTANCFESSTSVLNNFIDLNVHMKVEHKDERIQPFHFSEGDTTRMTVDMGSHTIKCSSAMTIATNITNYFGTSRFRWRMIGLDSDGIPCGDISRLPYNYVNPSFRYGSLLKIPMSDTLFNKKGEYCKYISKNNNISNNFADYNQYIIDGCNLRDGYFYPIIPILRRDVDKKSYNTPKKLTHLSSGITTDESLKYFSEIYFEELEMNKVITMNPTLLNAAENCRNQGSGIMVSVGHTSMETMCFYNGQCLLSSYMRDIFGGLHVTEYLLYLLRNRGINTTFSTAEFIKEKFCSLSPVGTQSSIGQTDLPDYCEGIVLTSEEQSVCNIILDPARHGANIPRAKERGVLNMIQRSIDTISDDNIRKDVLSNILIHGGTSESTYFSTSLIYSLNAVFPNIKKSIRSIGRQNRSIFVQVPESTWLTKKQYSEIGPQIIFNSPYWI
eukprot:TRINITY_DN3943_c1_g1_i5.p1 TRINITY_DN3943_c1_g1~~TRINITY_DN3943_c1_g1_i5.p1  ORF type:complete len:596 (+),score=106.87 TRINITY_DN3943_c1_g1_i5:665-2452(+)